MNAQTITGTESERDELENLAVFGRTLYVSPRPFVSEDRMRMSQQTLFEDDAHSLETNEQRRRQLAELQRKRADMLNRQHEFVMNRNEVKLKRTEEVTEFDTWCDQCHTFLSEAEAEIAEAEIELEKESELLTADIEQYQLML